jgi:hypothetical protein
MPWIIRSVAFARRAERLTRAGGCPDMPVIGPSSKSSCNGPGSRSSEEVALGKSSEVIGFNFLDGSIINNSGRYDPVFDQAAQHVRGDAIVFVVIGCHHPSPNAGGT